MLRQRKIEISPKTIHRPFGNYSHGILDSGSGLLVTSGQLGINLDGSIPSSFVKQAEICFSNILAPNATDVDEIELSREWSDKPTLHLNLSFNTLILFTLVDNAKEISFLLLH